MRSSSRRTSNGKPRARLALAGDEHFDAVGGGTSGGHLLARDARRELRRIAIATEVTKHRAAQISSNHPGEDTRSGVVRKMAVARHDTLLRRPRALRVVLQKLLVVVRLNDK